MIKIAKPHSFARHTKNNRERWQKLLAVQDLMLFAEIIRSIHSKLDCLLPILRDSPAESKLTLSVEACGVGGIIPGISRFSPSGDRRRD